MNDFSVGKLSNIAFIEMGISPVGSSCNSTGIGLPLLNGPTEFGTHHPTPVQYSTDARKVCVINDLLFCVRGSTTGKMNWANQSYAIGRGICAIRHKEGKEYRQFIKAVIDFQLNNLLAQATGSTFPNVSKVQLQDIEIPLLPLPTQKAIAHILGSIDDKMELLRQMNETLDAMARALFKSWFVDFDPVRKKAGALPTGLPKEIEDLFPIEFEDSELGEIPKGWKVGKLGEVADVNWGDTKTTKSSYTETGYIAFSASGQDGFLPNYDFDRKGIVVSAIGANSGQTWLVYGKWSCIKNTIRIWSSNESEMSTEYIYHYTGNRNFWNLRGSAQPFISQGDARLGKIIIPNKRLSEAFGKISESIYIRKFENENEIKFLSGIRDSLLQKLISGELELSNEAISKILEPAK